MWPWKYKEDSKEPFLDGHYLKKTMHRVEKRDVNNNAQGRKIATGGEVDF